MFLVLIKLNEKEEEEKLKAKLFHGVRLRQRPSLLWQQHQSFTPKANY